MPGMEQHKIPGGGLQHTSKILTLEGLLAKEAQEKGTFKMEQKTPYSLEEQAKFYMFAKQFLDSKLEHKLIFPSQGEADAIVAVITNAFGEGMASWKRVETTDGRHEYVYTINIRFPEIKQKYYPDISTEIDAQNYLSDTLGKTG